MAFTMEYGTGFEMGSNQIVSDSERYQADVLTEEVKTGNYALKLHGQNNARFDFQVSGGGSEIYIGVWYEPGNRYNSNDNVGIIVYTSDSSVTLRFDGTHWNARVGESQVAAGDVQVENAWHHVQLHISLADAGGVIETKIDGIDDIDYTGDTLSGSSDTITEIRFRGDLWTAKHVYWDDFCYGTGGWPGDIRFERLAPNADTATIEWTGSDGDQVDNYALVDEVPPSTADYVESVDNGDQDKYELEDFDATNKNPLAAILWAYAKKDEADAHQLKLILDDGTTESVGAAEDLLTSYTYLHRLENSAPSGGAWTDALLDALKAGVESVVV